MVTGGQGPARILLRGLRASPLLCRLVPGSVIRGVQLSVGLNLAQKGVALVAFHDAQHYRGITGWEGLVPGVVAACFILVTVYWPVRQLLAHVWLRQVASQPSCNWSSCAVPGVSSSLLSDSSRLPWYCVSSVPGLQSEAP